MVAQGGVPKMRTYSRRRFGFDFATVAITLRSERLRLAQSPGCEYNTRRIRSRAVPLRFPYSRNTAKMCSCALLTSPSFFSLSRWCDSEEPDIPSSVPISPTTIRQDGRQEHPHDAQPGLGPYGSEHIGITTHVLRTVRFFNRQILRFAPRAKLRQPIEIIQPADLLYF